MATNPIDDLAAVRKLKAENEALMRENETLKNGSGGGTSGGMEGRVAKLEALVETLRSDVTSIKKDVGDMRVSIATLVERVAHLPGKGFVITATTTTIAMLTGVVVFGEKIRSLLGLG
ncbi:hypothetical protein [Novosphingobium sp.]|uniref:hypothetical protein n=1 Tax=Novosphingobium sp. TaxID=1874826 RepID=UPI0035B2E519